MIAHLCSNKPDGLVLTSLPTQAPWLFAKCVPFALTYKKYSVFGSKPATVALRVDSGK